MGSHNEAVIGVRATKAVREAARLAADAEGWTLQAAITAFLIALATQPVEVLQMVTPYRQSEKPKGRPRKAAPTHDNPA